MRKKVESDQDPDPDPDPERVNRAGPDPDPERVNRAERVRVWGCSPARRQELIDFALLLEDAEEVMAENAAMAWVCDCYGIDVSEGYEWLLALPDYPYPWWRDDLYSEG
jgi:hypothetical protein